MAKNPRRVGRCADGDTPGPPLGIRKVPGRRRGRDRQQPDGELPEDAGPGAQELVVLRQPLSRPEVRRALHHRGMEAPRRAGDIDCLQAARRARSARGAGLVKTAAAGASTRSPTCATCSRMSGTSPTSMWRTGPRPDGPRGTARPARPGSRPEDGRCINVIAYYR